MSVQLNTTTAQNAYRFQNTNQDQPDAASQQAKTTRVALGAPTTTSANPAAGVADTFKAQFADLAGDKAAFHAMMKDVFGAGYDAATAEGFRKAALKGDFSWLPAVKFVDDATLGGALGAYDSENNVVYLNRVLASDPGFAASIYVEEAGHFLDTKLNTADTAGDEGELFRRLMAGENVSAADRATMVAENDFATINVDGKEIVVEQWNPFKAIAKGVKSVGKAIGKAAKAVGKAVVKAVKAVGSVIKAGVDFLVEKILTPVVKALMSTLGPLVERLGKELAPLIAAGGKVIELLEKVFGPIMKTIGDLAAPILKPLGKILGGIEKVTDAILGPFLKPLREGMKGLVTKLTDGARSAHVAKVPGQKAMTTEQRNANVNTAEKQLNLASEEMLSGATIGLAIIGGVAALTGIFTKLKKMFKKADAPGNTGGILKKSGQKSAKKKVSFEPTDVRKQNRLKSKADRADFAKKQNRKVNTKNGKKPIQHQGPRKNLGDGKPTKKGVTSKRDIEAIRAKQAARRNGKVKTQKDANRIGREHHADVKKDAYKARKAELNAKNARTQKQIDANKAEIKKLNRQKANAMSKKSRIEARTNRDAARHEARTARREAKEANRKAHAQDMQQNWNLKSSADKASYIKSIYGQGGYGR